MKEFSDSLPASELGHFSLNTFNFFWLIHLCASKLNKLNEEENETATISNFLHLFTFHQCNEGILKTIRLKIKKKTSIEAQSKGHAQTSESSSVD